MIRTQSPELSSPLRFLRAPAACTMLLLLAVPGAGFQRAERLVLPPGGSNWVRPPAEAASTLVTTDLSTGVLTPLDLAQALVGSGVTITNVQYQGAGVAAGTFLGGTGIVGFYEGVVLSSGNIASVEGAQNLVPDTSTDNLMPADADLDLLVGGATQDACVLEFDFECALTNEITFQYVFASEEYDEWVNSPYNDVFAFFLNGQNIALIPGTSNPVAINNVNCGNPYAPPGGPSCALYKTNDCDSLAVGFPCLPPLATEMDGMTWVFSVSATLQPGPNHMKFAIADRSDGVYDTNVFLRGHSFTCGPVVPVFEPPSPCGETIEAAVGVPCRFEVEAIAVNGYPGEAVTLDVSGDSVPLAGGTFLPPLPAGPLPEVWTDFEWTPQQGDVGTWHLQFLATDQLGATATCDVWIHVAQPPGTDECVPGESGVLDCPCSNNPADNFRGCDNSAVTGGARLSSIGAASLSADTVLFSTDGELPTALTILLQGDMLLPSGVVFGQGIRCIGGSLRRLYVVHAIAGEIVVPGPSDLSVSARAAALGDTLAPGGTRYYAAYYRDPVVIGGCPATSTFNMTQTQKVVWSS